VVNLTGPRYVSGLSVIFIGVIAKVGVLDFGVGNITSIINALGAVGANPIRATTPDLVAKSTHLVLPGVGAFSSGMRRLRESGLTESLLSHVNSLNRPILGICLGMQMLTNVSYEFGSYAGLGLIRGHVEKLPNEAPVLDLPHIGWSEVTYAPNMTLFSGIDQLSDFYFLHSFHVSVEQNCRIATARHGINFVAALEVDNIFGTQFHPEKSQTNGLRLLKNFVNAG